MNPDEQKDLIAYRMEQAQEALDDAAYLQTGGRGLNSVVNRIYYSMFYAVLALLQTTGNVPTKHTGVIGLFDKEFVLKGVFPKALSELLHRAFDLRQAADYRVRKMPSIDETRRPLVEATGFLAAIRGYLGQ